MNKIDFKIKLLIAIFFLIIIGIINGILNNYVMSAYESYDINSISETKYPGIKSALQNIKKQYPNWKIKVLYTGLDWNNVINSQYSGHGASPKNLIHESYSQGWKCYICGDERYDVSGEWCCASKEAIEYMMDPRNSLDANYIFQFQDLSSSEGDREAVKQMVKGTFLNKESYIDAIMEAAKTEGISPFHLVARIKQEQGSNGAGAMNGYIYRTEDGEFVKVYNLFNIGVSGNDYNEGLLAGAKYAYEQGWLSVEASIKGGAKFIKDGYIDQGQTTLYFQKFDVIEQGGLYNHQYMQNVRAANDEGNVMYNTYKSNGILNSSFEFTIPLYENMPQKAVSRPTDTYVGNINTELININVVENSGKNYISGYVYIAEWVGNDCRTPRMLPKITIKSTDGKFSTDCYVGYEGGIKYYFDKCIDEFDMTKKYYIQATLTSAANVAPANNKTQTVKLKDKVLKQDFKGREIFISNNNIVFSNEKYQGSINTELINLNVIQNTAGDNYISGYIYIAEWVGNDCRTPSTIPEITIKSTDGKISKKAYVGYEENIKYYFDANIEEFDVTKQYYIEAKLTAKENTSSEKNKTQRVYVSNRDIGNFKGRDINVIAKDNTIRLNYKGNVNTELISIGMVQNSAGANFISGYVYIAEWFENECKTPTPNPVIYLKSTDGSFSKKAYIGYEGSIKYYFDINIKDIDVNKEYYLEAQLTNVNNISSNKKQTISIPNKTIGENKPIKVEAKNNKIKIIDTSLYYGTINTELYKMSIIQNSSGANFISGYIYIAEWINNQCKTPSKMPEIYLKSTDGKYSAKTYIGYEGGIEYYFDKSIEGLDTSKQYYLEVKLTNSKNTASVDKQTQKAKITKKGQIGICTNGNKVSVDNNNNISIVETGKYYGTINTELYKMSIIQNSSGANFISGYIYIAEWINNQCKTPSKMPEIYLKSTDGKYSAKTYIGYEGGIEYYFDKSIEGLDTSKEYYLEVKLTNSKNTASKEEQTQKAKITPQGKIGTCTNGNIVSIQGTSIKITKK